MEKKVIKYSTVSLKRAEWALFPTYLGKPVARFRIGIIPPEVVTEEWSTASVIEGMKQEVRVVQINWLDNRLEGIIRAIQSDLNTIAKIIELFVENKLTVRVEARPPAYDSGG